jgi:hypothetical protein
MEHALVDPNSILDTGAPHSMGGISAAAKLANALGQQLLLDAPTDQVKTSLGVQWSRRHNQSSRPGTFKFKTFMVVQLASVFTLRIPSPLFYSVMMFLILQSSSE